MSVFNRLKQAVFDWVSSMQRADQAERSEPVAGLDSGLEMDPTKVVPLRRISSSGGPEYRTVCIGLEPEEWDALSQATMAKRGAPPSGDAIGSALRAFLQMEAIVSDPSQSVMVFREGIPPQTIHRRS